MKSLQIIIFIILTNACFGQIGSIKGYVFDRRENKGLPFADVYIEKIEKGATTDRNGNFKLDSITNGQYFLKISCLGYGDTTILVDVEGKIDVRIVLPPPCKYDKNRNDKTCPICNKQDSIIPIRYGLIVETKNKKSKEKSPEYHIGGCNISYCMPTWYCKRDQLEF